MDSVTNAEFLAVLAEGIEPAKETLWVTSVDDVDDERKWKGHAYSEAAALPEDWANYVSMASLKTGARSRSADNFSGLLAVVLDDVGTKAPKEVVHTLKPSWVFETSPKNYQVGYLLDQPCRERKTAERLCRGLAEKGYRDKGGVAPVQYYRVPVGINLKKDHFATVVKLWKPERRYTLEEVAAAFDVRLELKRGRQNLTDKLKVSPTEDPWFGKLQDLGLLRRESTTGWYNFDECPWGDQHSKGKDGAAYKPGGLFKCHHGSCAERRFDDLREWLEETHGVDGDELDRKMPALPLSIRQMSRRYVYVAEIESFFDIEAVQIIGKEAVADLYLHACDGENASRLLLAFEQARKVRALRYEPGLPLFFEHEGLSIVNQWKPDPLPESDEPPEVIKKAVRPWVSLLKWMYPDPLYQEIVVWYYAHLVRRRGEKINWGLVQFANAQGVGRDSLIRPVQDLLGDRNCRVITGEALDSQFNPYVLSELIVANEMDTSHETLRHRVYNKLKELMTTPPDRIDVNIKNVPQFQNRKAANVVIHTNTAAALAIAETDRRLAVVASPRTREEALQRGKDGKYAELHAAYADENWTARFVAFLNSIDLDNREWNAKSHAPHTRAKDEMRDAASSPLKSGLREAVRSCPFPIASANDLVTRAGIDEGHSSKGVINILTELECRSVGRHKADGEMVSLFALNGSQLSEKDAAYQYRSDRRRPEFRLWLERKGTDGTGK